MPSDKRNSITTKETGLTFSLFDVISAQEVPFSMYNAFFMDLYYQCRPLCPIHLDSESVNLAVAHDGFSS